MEVPLVSRRRARGEALQKIQHAVPAVGLLFAGVQGLSAGAHGFELALALTEVATSALLVGAIARSVRRVRAHGRLGLDHAEGVEWIDIWAAGVLFAEAAERWHLTGHLARPTILTALVTLALGLFHGRLAAFIGRRRSLRVGDEGIYVSARPFRTLRATWPELAEITTSERVGVIRTRAGRIRRLDFTDLENADAVRAALDAARVKMGVGSVAEPRSADE